MTADLPAHVLRLEHTPVAAALQHFSLEVHLSATNLHETRQKTRKITNTQEPSRSRVILGLDRCRLCGGTRRSPETDQPCEVCTVTGGSWRVVP